MNIKFYKMQKLFYKFGFSGALGLLVFDEFSALLLLILFFLMLLDTIAGVWVAYKAKTLQSKLMRKFTEKASGYSITILAFYFVSQIQFAGISFLWIFKTCTIYIIIIELFSLMEKMAYLGFNIPFKILDRLNDDFLKMIPKRAKNREELEKMWKNN